MKSDQALEFVKNILSPRQLSFIEEVVFVQAWEGQAYRSISTESAYDEGYLRDVGANLWQCLSQELDCKITKKNLRSLLSDLAQNDDPAHSALNSLVNQRLGVMEFPGAPLPFGSPLYVERYPIEELAIAEIWQPGSLIRIQGSQNMGKTSLINHLFGKVRQAGIHTLRVDVRQAGAEALNNLDRFLRWFCWNLGQQLQIPSEFDRYWFEMAGSSLSCTTYVQEVFLNRLQQPLLVVIDKVHHLVDYEELAKNFFPLLRSWHEQARTDQNWQKLRLILTSSTEFNLPLQPHQSPFNVGLPLSLPMFTPDQALDLAKRYGLESISLGDTQALQPLMELVAGHPYLLQLVFYHLRSGDIALEQLLQSAPTHAGIYHSYLQPFWQVVRRDDRLFPAFVEILSGTESIALDPTTSDRLIGMGLLKLEGFKTIMGCNLYQQYFRACLEGQN
ncbi:AAA-like domain-containing protein [Dapis sp. BLCC M126]|uniref:AAA-like domain-containing protein n=1 Tax=Dapis sp. BLCC M126 TaxID=3400189 RepID=UPI003CE9F1B7